MCSLSKGTAKRRRLRIDDLPLTLELAHMDSSGLCSMPEVQLSVRLTKLNGDTDNVRIQCTKNCTSLIKDYSISKWVGSSDSGYLPISGSRFGTGFERC